MSGVSTSRKAFNYNEVDYMSAEKDKQSTFKQGYQRYNQTSVKKFHGDEESKISNIGINNQLDDSEISHVNELDKIRNGQRSTNLIATGYSTTLGTQNVQPDIVVYKHGVADTHDYSTITSNVKNEPKNDKPIILEKNFEPKYGLAKVETGKEYMNYTKLCSVLKKYNEYPEKYRLMIWKYLLSLPMRKASFESYIKRDPHPAFLKLYKTYKVKSYSLYNKLVRVCSALAYWCPLFAQVSYLPDLVFPFVKIIKGDDLVLFEVIMCFLMQHCQLWFEKFPNDPVHVLKTSVEVVIAKESVSLYKHFAKLGFGVTQYAWPMLKNAFSVVLPKDDWLRLFDQLFTHHNKPELIYYFTAAYILHFRGTLTRINTIEGMYDFVEEQNPVDMKSVLKDMFRLYKKYKDDDEVYIGVMGNYIPLNATHSYPVFTNYAPDSVAFSQKMNELRYNEEAEAEQKEGEVKELRQRVDQLLLRDKHEREQNEALSQNAAMQYLRNKHDLEQQILDKLRQQDERTEYLRQLENTLKTSITTQDKQRNMDRERINHEYEERRRFAEYEHKTRLQDEELRNLEHKATQRVLEMISIREKEDYQRQLSMEANHKIREEEARDKAMMEKWKLEDEERKLKSELMIREKQRTREHQVFEYSRQKLEMEHNLHQLEKELHIVQLEKERKLRQAEEDYMFTATKVKEEGAKKNEYLEMLEQTGMQEIVNRNKAINDMTDQRVQAIYKQKQEIEEALEFERQEQIRLQKLVEKKRFEEELMNMKLMQDAKQKEEDQQIEKLNMMMEQERKERIRQNTELYYKEKEITEKERFNNLLVETDDNLRKMEEEKILRANLELKKSVDQAMEKAKHERENQLEDIVVRREMNFQNYTLQRQNQIRADFMKNFDPNQDIDRQAQSFVHNYEQQQLISPYKQGMQEGNYKSEMQSPDSENRSPNNPNAAFSDLSCSMNQKYMNKDVYNLNKSQNRTPLGDKYPFSENLNDSRVEMESQRSSAMSQSEQSEGASQADDEDERILRRHEESKLAFEAYRRSMGTRTITNLAEDAVMPIKDSTFGAPSQSSQDYANGTLSKMSIPFGSMEGHPENYESRSQYPHRGGHFSNLSSPITEEDEGESNISYQDGQNMSYSSQASNGFYSKRPGDDQYIANASYTQQEQVQMRSPSIGENSSEYENTSDISSSTISQQEGYKHSHQIDEMSINPFYRPNPAFGYVNEWKKAN